MFQPRRFKAGFAKNCLFAPSILHRQEQQIVKIEKGTLYPLRHYETLALGEFYRMLQKLLREIVGLYKYSRLFNAASPRKSERGG